MLCLSFRCLLASWLKSCVGHVEGNRQPVLDASADSANSDQRRQRNSPDTTRNTQRAHAALTTTAPHGPWPVHAAISLRIPVPARAALTSHEPPSDGEACGHKRIPPVAEQLAPAQHACTTSVKTPQEGHQFCYPAPAHTDKTTAAQAVKLPE